jgi:hypothetical protein
MLREHYQLSASLLALTDSGEGQRMLKSIPSGAVVEQSGSPEGTPEMVTVIHDGDQLRVFATDLAERSAPIDAETALSECDAQH